MHDRLTILTAAIRRGEAWGTVQLPTGHGDTCGATLEEAEEALSGEVDRLRADNKRLRDALLEIQRRTTYGYQDLKPMGVLHSCSDVAFRAITGRTSDETEDTDGR